ncbi:MAG: hypothetical protein CFE23_13925 [Flavobacterium sp. BFFFF1]|uniref:Omp28-related outer membrane protein n=1 Tax=Flavobacterium sp. BFFFF1 TaxID=2015557 RepID=UPI000BD7C65E|nr:Omp28-related outer membrane protein [Flavobacterium sp. BFFFF1]OYU79456.1 MAG: hypothetical protein CFE23_13925 [Flavobacterium sp. BFFFF1]
MKRNLKLKSLLSSLLLLVLVVGCTETESDFEETQTVTSVTISTDQSALETGGTATFTVLSNLGTNLTSASVFYINDVAIANSNYTFLTAGTYNVKAVYQNLTTNVIQITVQDQVVIPTQFVNRVLVEEYSGTWCGNCPRILYGTQLLKEQTDKEVSVQIHLFNNDPFITAQGNALATAQNVSGVPTGRINRTINWSGPQYQNVNQVLNEIKPGAPVGIAINSTLDGGNINLNLLFGYNNTALQTKLVVYIVEDNLFYSQANYSSNLYNGLSSIPNFEYDGVLRSIVTPISGEAITVSGSQVTKNYTIALPSNVANANNAKIVAFLVDANSNAVLNVRQARIGQTQVLESL